MPRYCVVLGFGESDYRRLATTESKDEEDAKRRCELGFAVRTGLEPEFCMSIQRQGVNVLNCEAIYAWRIG